jgi:TPR repeat protein
MRRLLDPKNLYRMINSFRLLMTLLAALLFAVPFAVPSALAQADAASGDEEFLHGDSDAAATPQTAGTPLIELLSRAEAGGSAAQFELGNRYLYGTDVELDNFAAAKWFRQAADQGNHNAQYNLGVMALNGIGVITDFDEALRWFHLAAEHADTTAQFTLGVIYANGRGVAQDLTQAHMWFTVAAAGGEKSAAVNAVLLQEILSVEQLEKSQSDAKVLIEKFNQRQ